MSFPYPTIDKPRATTHTCILPHKMYGINTYGECVAAMKGCRDVAAAKYDRSGDATHAHYAHLFHTAAQADQLTKVNTGASATAGARNDWDYHGVCSALLTDCSRTNLWPSAREATVQTLQRFHAGAPPTTRPDMPTLSCVQARDGSFACNANTTAPTAGRTALAPHAQGRPFPLHWWR